MSNDSTRREFVCGTARALAAGVVTVAAAPLLASCGGHAGRDKPRAFEATFDVSALNADGASLVTASGGVDGARILIVRAASRRYLGLSLLCTHEGCPLNPPDGALITCPCHGSQFDLEGHVHRGPAQLALLRYDTRFDAKSRRVTVGSDG